MTFEAWDEALTLNHAIIDHDHQDLFESIQRLRAALSAGQSAEPTGGRQERVAAAIAELRRATQEHFRSEEWIMQMGGYPGIDAHRHQHVLLLAEYDKFVLGRLGFEEENVALAMKFMQEWFEFHIRIWDSALVRWLNGLDGKSKRSLRQEAQ